MSGIKSLGATLGPIFPGGSFVDLPWFRGSGNKFTFNREPRNWTLIPRKLSLERNKPHLQGDIGDQKAVLPRGSGNTQALTPSLQGVRVLYYRPTDSLLIAVTCSSTFKVDFFCLPSSFMSPNSYISGRPLRLASASAIFSVDLLS